MSDQDLLEREQETEPEDLGVHPERREAEAAELENLYNNSSGDGPPDGDIPYRPEGKKDNLIKRARSRFKDPKSKLRRRILPLGAASGAAIILVMLLLIAMSSTKLIHLAQNITVWNMNRSARSWRQNISRVTEEQIGTEVMEESRYNQLKARFGETKAGRAIEKVNSYRPSVVLDKMHAGSQPIFREVGERKFLKFLGPKKEFVGWNIDGATIEKTNSRFFHPIANYKDKIRFSADAQAAFERKFPDTNTLVRNKAVRLWLKERDVKLYGWRQRGESFKGLTREAAAAQEAQAASQARRTPPGPCKVPSTCETSKAATEAAEKRVTEAAKNPEGTGGAAGISEAAAEDAAATIKNGGSWLESALGKVSIVYTVALPLCLIYEGSLNNAGETIDKSETAHTKTYFDVRSSADQQEAGEINSEALQAKADKYGLIGDSIPERRARGEAVDTVAETNPAAMPQASSTGSYSLIDAYLAGFMGKEAADFLDSIVDKACPIVTDLRVGLAITALEVALLVGSAGSSGAAKEAGKVGIDAVLANATSRLVTKTVAGEVVGVGGRYVAGNLLRMGGKFALKTGLFVGATFGITELAHAAVLKHSNLENAGLATDELAATQADMGGNIYNNVVMKEINRGIPMTTPDLVADKVLGAAYIKQQNQQKPAFERYFALANPDSLLSKTGAFAVSSFSGKTIFAKLTSFLANPLSNFGSIVGHHLTPSKVFAAETVKGAGEYNIVQWGYTEEENQLIDNDEEYSPIVNELVLEASNKAEEIQDKYGKCFTESNGTLLSSGWIVRNDDGTVVPNQGDCSPNKLGLHNPDGFGDLVFRWRLKYRYDATLGHLKDIQNVEVSP